ncbi:MAG: hypothetical protein ACLFV4_02950 [Candidatus Hydrogenedentota bacterium]
MCTLVSCQLFQRGGPVPEGLREGDGAVRQPLSPEEREAALLDRVRAQIEAADEAQEERRRQVRYQRPFYFREYAEYPEGIETVTTEIEPTDSRITPYTATVEIPRTRFSTRMHRSAEAARQDSNFFRSIGRERLSYELRNNRWVKTGSLFVAERTEEYVDGEWRPVQEVAARSPEPEPAGWFRRAWNTIVGD